MPSSKKSCSSSGTNSPATNPKRAVGPGSCDACRKSKRACDGRAPCATCVAKGHDCTYNELRKREASQGMGACDCCRATKRACDGRSPCSTCIKRGKECTYAESKRAPAAAGLLVAGDTVDALVSAFSHLWGSLFPQLNREGLSEHKGQVYRFTMSCIMAQLSRTSNDAAGFSRHLGDAVAFSERCEDELLPQVAESFALLAWNLLNTDMDAAAKFARAAESIVLRGRGGAQSPTASSTGGAAAMPPHASSSWSGSAAVVLLLRVLTDSNVLGMGNVDAIAAALAKGMGSLEVGSLASSCIRHLWAAVALVPGLRSALLSASTFSQIESNLLVCELESDSAAVSGVFLSSTGTFTSSAAAAAAATSSTTTAATSCSSTSPAVSIAELRALADQVVREHAHAVVAWSCESNLANKRAATADPFALLTAAVQSIVEIAADSSNAGEAARRLEQTWGSIITSDDDLFRICVRNPIGIKAIAIATAAAVRCGAVLPWMQWVEPALRRLQQLVPDVATGSHFISQYLCSTPAGLFWREEEGESGDDDRGGWARKVLRPLSSTSSSASSSSSSSPAITAAASSGGGGGAAGSGTASSPSAGGQAAEREGSIPETADEIPSSSTSSMKIALPCSRLAPFIASSPPSTPTTTAPPLITASSLSQVLHIPKPPTAEKQLGSATEKVLAMLADGSEDVMMAEVDALIKAHISMLLFSPETVAIESVDSMQPAVVPYTVEDEDDGWSSICGSSGCCGDSLSDASTETDIIDFFLSSNAECNTIHHTITKMSNNLVQNVEAMDWMSTIQ